MTLIKPVVKPPKGSMTFHERHLWRDLLITISKEETKVIKRECLEAKLHSRHIDTKHFVSWCIRNGFLETVYVN